MNKDTSQATKTKPMHLAVPLLILGLSVAALLFADTYLTAWAEAAELNHVFQHILIFLAGMGVGGGGLSLRHQLQKR